MVDSDGYYWLTIPFNGKDRRYDPGGKLIGSIELPVDLPTCCEFGGRDLDTLYVTSATLRRDARPSRRPDQAGRAVCDPRARHEGAAAGAVQGIGMVRE